MNAQRISAVLFVAGLTWVIWWNWSPAPTVPPSTALAESVTAPVVAGQTPTATPPAVTGPQAELSTAIPDIIRILQSGDFVALAKTYMPPEPGQTEEEGNAEAQKVQADMQKPNAQPMVQSMISDMQFIQKSPPVISDHGNRATYALPAGSADKNVVFEKINGRWYLK